ncbi:SNARE associated Golgi protein [Tolumonas auensis DSM 9187]|uniref:SNARE associated Golgi protein n=1 Tax=Tolumonas auensis (strain DSM 9187 / NBRC 110442 / TA 4) TaxID=595494 RepID=C4LCQ7_TOLAT|nr:bifunctional TVP38/TMEM64 family protein/FAD-dependent oxidoreductase [Tolumonas auensis]ACQ92621.1 SNARE associated Golgi protein [Tolumonas auensis DSM 9187]
MKKIMVISVITLLVILIYAFDIQAYLSVDGLKHSVSQLEMWRVERPLLVGALFFSLYILIALLSLPGAAVMTIGAGALFGLLWGSIIASFASSIGATLAFLLSRYLLRDVVQNRFDKQLTAINAGMAKDGLLYLFALRLVPIFPFFLINLLMGLTTIRTRDYYWVSQLGMLAGTLVYVNAGTQLIRLTSLSEIMSPALLASFALLGVFPMMAKYVVKYLERRRVYARWSEPEKFDRNLIVIGGGAAGLVTSYIAAAVKAKVTLVEAHKMGGDCLNYGCVPSKAIIKSARLAHTIRHGEHYGLENLTPTFSFRNVMARVHEVIRHVAPHDSIERYTRLGVEVLEGYATIIDPWTVEIKLNNGGTQRLTTRSIVIATGARPVVPPLPGLEEVGYLTSDTMWRELAKLDAPPARLVILGGGPIGCELSQSFARLGSQVTQVEMASRIMIREDEDVSALARDALTRDGVLVLTEHKALRCEKEGERKFIVLEHKNIELRIEFDVLLCAVGRAARLSGYGLEALGIETQRTVITNDYLETLYPNIFAAGDVAGPYQFTHTAGHQAWYAAVNALFGDFKRFKVDYSVVPWATFIDPEVARVGLNEQDAREKGIPYEITRFGLADLDRAIADGTTHGFIKVLTVPGKDRILGVTIVGEHAADLLAEFVLAMKHRLGLNQILGTIHTYPTLSEANKYVAGEWKRQHAPQRILNWLARYHSWKRGA